MKVIHVPFCFYPDPVGGTEVYVQALAYYQQEQGTQVLIAAPGQSNVAYTHNGLRVCRFSVSHMVTDLRNLYGEGDVQAAQAFGRVLDDEHPDVVHLHAFTQGVSVRLVREAKRRGIRVAFTYHTPTVSCQRGTLMHWGREVCDGKLDIHTCARCTLHGLGLHSMSSVMLGSLPTALGHLLGALNCAGGLWTALRMTALIELRQRAFRALMTEVDHVVALCQWVKDLLLHNGVRVGKITVLRHGLPHSLVDSNQAMVPASPTCKSLRIACLGRLDPTKGLDILVRALRLLPEVPVELHLYGVVQNAAGTAYLRQLKALAAGDPRIAFLPAVASDRIVSLLSSYHLLAVPSRWLETGPLVVLEAFAAGIPVIGSNLGGIAELVEHGVNGLLLEPDSIEGWCQALRQLAEDRALLMQLRTGVRPPRGMAEVAEEMVALYRAVLQEKFPRQETATLE